MWQEPVAIKFFTLLEDAKPELRDRLVHDFIQEGKLMTKLSSQSAAIVQARDIGRYSCGEDAWIPFMVLEWLEGIPLDRALIQEREANLPPRNLQQALSLLQPVAFALEIAHQSNVAHRDLKPANVMIVGDPRAESVPVKVLDFGIAKVMSEHQQLHDQLQQTGQQITAFTPNYGAPEQFSRRFGATGPWTDVYAMALILIELLQGGMRALAGSSFFEFGSASCDGEKRPTPRNLGLEVSDEVEAVFQKAVALQPAERYPTMGEFWSALHRLVLDGDTWTGQPSQIIKSPTEAGGGSGLPVPTHSGMGSLPTEAIPTANGPTMSSLAGPARTRPPGSGKPILIGIGVSVVAAAAAVALFMTSSPPAAPGVTAGSSAESAPTTTAAVVPSATQTSEETEAAPSETAEPLASASASASAVAEPQRAVPPPKKLPTPPPPSPAAGDDGVDPWNPNNFGGRR